MSDRNCLVVALEALDLSAESGSICSSNSRKAAQYIRREMNGICGECHHVEDSKKEFGGHDAFCKNRIPF